MDLKTTLLREIAVSSGCTEIAAVGYAVSVAKELTNEPYDVEIFLDYNTFKNAAFAGIPGGYRGLFDGVRRALTAKPKKLETLSTANGIYDGDVNIRIEPLDLPYVLILVKINDKSALIAYSHANLIYSGESISLKEALKLSKKIVHDLDYLRSVSYQDLYNSVDELLELYEIQELLEKSEMNLELIKEAKIAKNMKKDAIEEMLFRETFAAVEARMMGSKLPALTIAGSGNQGILTTVPLISYAKEMGIPKGVLNKSILISWITTVYATAFTGYITPMCGAGIKAGPGLAAGFGYMLGGEFEVVEGAVINHIASLAGIICDGAKLSCASKIALATITAFKSAILAKNGIVMDYGITGKSVEESFKNIGEILKDTFTPANDIIVAIIAEKLK